MSIKLFRKKGVIRSAIWTIIILLIPLILTLLNPDSSINGGKGGGWDWSLLDFLVMGGLIFCAGLALDFVSRLFTQPEHRVIAYFFIVIGLLIIWIELAADGVSKFFKMIFG